MENIYIFFLLQIGLDGYPKLALSFTFSTCLSSDRSMGKVAFHFLEFELKPKLPRYRKIILIGCRAQKHPDITFAFGGIETFEKMSTQLSFCLLVHTELS